ncbi:MAG TPA: type 4a pilus biogenesis protein PilO [Acidimicrobiales bacterium]|nr:type 4a pilus biogenesis protein PilO [Acidimicrobiales bacterium]
MNRINRPVVFGAAGVIVAMVLAWWFLLWGPRNRSYNDANTAAQQAQGQVEQLQAQLNRLESIKQQLPLLQAQLAKMQVAVPDKPQLDQIILNINTAAVNSGVQLLSIAPTPPAATATSGAGAGTSGAPPSIRVALSLKGGYNQVLDFINRLDGLPRLVVIDTVGLTSNATGPSGTSTVGEAGATTATTAPAELTISLTVRLFTTTAAPAAGATTTTTAPSAASGSTTTTVAGGGTATTSTTAPTTATTSGNTGG